MNSLENCFLEFEITKSKKYLWIYFENTQRMVWSIQEMFHFLK